AADPAETLAFRAPSAFCPWEGLASAVTVERSGVPVSTTRIESTAYGAAALERLQAVVARLKADDPMTPVTLLLPNNLAGVIARRHLARASVGGLYLATLERLA